MGSRRGPSLVLVVVAAASLAFALRLAPLFWSPLPATLDGFRYVTLAETLLRSGALPLDRLDADEFGFTLLLATASDVTGVRPLALAQPLVAVTGAATPIVAVAFVSRLGGESRWPSRRVRQAAALAGLAVAVEGIYLRRTGVPDEEAIALLLVPVVALAAHRFLADRRGAWGLALVVLLAALPPLHNLGSLVAVLTVGGLAVLHLARRPDRWTAGVGLALAVGSWGYFLGYYELAERLGLRLTYSGVLRAKPGLFVAWLVLLAAGVAWFRSTGDRARRATLLIPVVGLVIVLANVLAPVFPGTIRSPPVVTALVVLLVVPVAYAARAAPVFARGTGLPLLALFAATVAVTFYALTAALTPEFFGVVMRIQTYAHLPVLVLAAVAAVTVEPWWPGGEPRGRAVAVALLCVVLVLTVPLGFLNLDTGSSPSTTFESEYAAVGTTAGAVTGPFATDHSLSRVAIHAYGRQNATYLPTRTWLTGGPPPGCPTLAQRSWTTTGAHLFPAQPQATAPARFTRWRTQHHQVYAAGGHDPLWLVVPVDGSGAPC